MKLTYFRHSPSNFGDEINATMWSHLLPPGFLDDDDRDLFLGVGSILWPHLPKSAMKHVIGSGWGGYSGTPDVSDGSWNFVWVRGPITARQLGLSPESAITDAAVLLRETPVPPPKPGQGPAFMPHFESTMRGTWERACKLADITYLDPRADPGVLLGEIRGAPLIITEAMHGAIIADAFRIPWIGIVPFFPQHRMKWTDWAQSLDIELRPVTLPPSSMLEAYTLLTGRPGKGAKSNRILRGRAAAPANAALSYVAANRLSKLARSHEPQLSSDAAIERATDRCMAALHRFVLQRTAPRQSGVGR